MKKQRVWMTWIGAVMFVACGTQGAVADEAATLPAIDPASINLTDDHMKTLIETALADEAAARELYQSFAARADAAACRERLGMDRLTRKLLMQRFDEDMARIAAMARVEVI